MVPLNTVHLALDPGRGAFGRPHGGRPPAPLDAVRARGRREGALAVLAAQLLHRWSIPGLEHAAVPDVPERRLDVVVAFARGERAVPEDVPVVPEVRARHPLHRQAI